MESDETLRELFETTLNIAVIGIKTSESEDAFRVPRYMQQAGFRILPVNPKFEQVLGETCVGSLSEIDVRALLEAKGDTNESQPAVDIVNLFRASENVPGHVEDILTLKPRPRAVWMQLGIHHGPSAQRLREAGILVIQDRCIMVDHRRLFGPSN